MTARHDVPRPPAEVDALAYREAAGRFASGITVVTTVADDVWYGVTVSAFASLSINPLLVTVSVNERSPLLPMVERSGRFAVSVLERSQERVSAYFATRDRDTAGLAFPGIDAEPVVTGAPVISGCLSYFDCETHTVLPGGDHRILVGRVRAAGGADGTPLLHFLGGYHALAEDQQRDSAGALAASADALAVQLHLLRLERGHLLDAQAAIEPATAALAAGRLGGGELTALRDCLDQARQAVDDPERFTRLSNDFHLLLARMSGNAALEAAAIALSRSFVTHYTDHTTTRRARSALRAHQAVLDAVAAGDAEAARALMGAHLRTVSAAWPAADDPGTETAPKAKGRP
ncbi:flavin reductase [Streptomyces profundus]|uniref:flavin reductase n=1 Tax=Streptomyces profundus TaxID=2867410 RepID=UPI001D15F678|nr:flavin reductase [Streptomyces sp. MA3_2.13]UED83251.1 flavin reductase [Streptomyces sp. MA3_2.13]